LLKLRNKENEFVKDQKSMMINLGCGTHFHKEWINIDFKSSHPLVISCDLTKGIPLDSNSVDVVYHSHLLEHFSKSYAPLFLKECFRVLKPGGIIRVVVPDLETIVRLYLNLLEKSLQGDEQAQKRYEWILLELFDQMVRNKSGGEMLEYWKQNPMPAENFVFERAGSEVKEAVKQLRQKNKKQVDRIEEKTELELDPLSIGKFRLSGEVHQWMYDRYSLGKLLKEAGFEKISFVKADESRIPEFNSYFLDINTDGSVRKPDSLFMEATKPLSSKK
jgi:predicted SAM-dependent methyltransferase